MTQRTWRLAWILILTLPMATALGVPGRGGRGGGAGGMRGGGGGMRGGFGGGFRGRPDNE